MQVVDSLSGDLMDEFVLTKPLGWKPDLGRQLHTLALFHRHASHSCSPCLVPAPLINNMWGD